MKGALKTIVVVLMLLAAVIVAYRMTRPASDAGEAARQKREPVRTGNVAEGPIREEVPLTGEVKAVAEVALAPKVSGRLMQLAADEGADVKQGQLVAVLDKDVFQAQLDHAQAALLVAKANVNAAEVRKENSGRDYQRVEALAKQGTSTAAALDDAEAAFKVAAAGVDVAKATQSQAEAVVELAQIALREATLLAPFDAVVSKKLLDVGAYVSAGQAVVSLVAVDQVKVIAGVGERYLADLAPGRTIAKVTVDALAGEEFSGTLYRVSPTIEPETRTAEAEVRIANEEHRLKPGMYARVTLVTKEKPIAILMPSDALLGSEGGYYAHVVKDGRASRAAVEVGLRSAQEVEVLKGLSPGETVVTSGEGNLYDGAAVAVEGEKGQ